MSSGLKQHSWWCSLYYHYISSSNSHQSHYIGIIGQRLTTIGGQQPMFWGFRSQTSDIGKSLFNINIRVSDYPLVLPLLVAKHLQERTPLVDLFFWDVRIVMLAGFVSDLYQHLWPGDFENHRKKWDQWKQRYIGTISHSPVDSGMIVCKKSHLRPPNSGQRMPLFLSSSFQEAVVTVQSWSTMHHTFSLWQKQAEQRRSQSTLTSADQFSENGTLIIVRKEPTSKSQSSIKTVEYVLNSNF